MTTIGLVGAGHMGAGLGWALRQGGHDVRTTLAGRSGRTARLAAAAGMATAPDLPTLLSEVDIVLVVTPPAAAVPAAEQIAAAAGLARPLIADLNATAPSTVEAVATVLAAAGLDLVDGAISGPPPTVRPGARIYLSGPRAAELAALHWTHATAVVVGDTVGTASAVKMCTASVYKGLVGLYAQALRTAAHHGVLDVVLADLAGLNPRPHLDVASAATKADRYVAEMLEISSTQEGAGLPGSLFAAYAEVYAGLARTPLAADDPESIDRNATPAAVLARLAPTPSGATA